MGRAQGLLHNAAGAEYTGAAGAGKASNMSGVLKVLGWGLGALVLLAGALALWLWLAPPAMLRVAAGYAAKIVCSGVFVAGRDAAEVLRIDVQAPGHPLLGFVTVSVDREARVVRAGLLGFAGRGLAVARDGTGCASVPDGNLKAAAAHRVARAQAPPATPGLWPQGDEVGDPAAAVQALLRDPTLTGPGMRAVLVLRDGRIAGETYAEGFSARTPLAGWSITKTVTAALIGTLMREGRLGLGDTRLFAEWGLDARANISLGDLMAMSSGLAFNEAYGSVSDVTRMLYLEPDMARFAASQPQVHAAGRKFSYASGTTLLLARMWQGVLADPAQALAYPQAALFEPLGMRTAVMEADARGTFVGSSYMHASARDWGRFAQLLLDDGMWAGRRLLPPAFVSTLRLPAPAAEGRYGRGQVWLRGPRGALPADQDADTGFTLPADTFWMLGHDGQSIAVVPSRNLAVVRLGLTPSRLGYRPQALLQAVLAVPR